jgi:hypothetical protein
MLVCTKCGERVPEDKTHLHPILTAMEKEDHRRFLEQCAAQGLDVSSYEPKPPKHYHYRTVVVGNRRPGVIGGWKYDQTHCGPLRPTTQVEDDAAEWEEKMLNLFK